MHGEIQPVVLEFASHIISRAATLVVCDDDVFAVAGRGVSTLEVDPPPLRVPDAAAD